MESAFAFAALTSKPLVTEVELYEKIVEIPQYEAKLLQLLDKEDEEGVVEDNFEKFQQLYHPVWKNKFREVVDINDGVLRIS